jgi:hypothetical protein
MAISAGNVLAESEPQDLQYMDVPRDALKQGEGRFASRAHDIRRCGVLQAPYIM